MKKALCAAILSFVAMHASAAKWIDVIDGRVAYDAASLVTSKIEGDYLLIEAWVRAYNTLPENSEHKDIGHLKHRILIRCGYKKETMPLRFVSYNRNGDVIDDIAVPASMMKWRDVVPDSEHDVLATTLCRLAYNKHLRPNRQQDDAAFQTGAVAPTNPAPVVLPTSTQSLEKAIQWGGGNADQLAEAAQRIRQIDLAEFVAANPHMAQAVSQAQNASAGVSAYPSYPDYPSYPSYPSYPRVRYPGTQVYVRGYFRKNGTYVSPHYRSAPRRR